MGGHDRRPVPRGSDDDPAAQDGLGVLEGDQLERGNVDDDGLARRGKGERHAESVERRLEPRACGERRGRDREGEQEAGDDVSDRDPHGGPDLILRV